MPASPEVTGITIHRGELLQIKRMITEDGQKRGNLHGLFTESYQPVILIVFGGDKEQRDGCEQNLLEGHALKKLGEWYVKPNDKDINKDFLTIVFDNEGEPCNIFHNGKEVQQEIIEGQSSFRRSPSVRDMLPNTSKNPDANAPIMDQWYDKDHGPAIMTGIHNVLTKNGLTIQGITRDKSTYDITMNIQDGSGALVKIEFPNDFPTTKPNVIFNDGRVEELAMSRIDEASPPDQVVDSFSKSLRDCLKPATQVNEDREKGKPFDDRSQGKSDLPNHKKHVDEQHQDKLSHGGTPGNADNGAGCSDDDNGDGNSGDADRSNQAETDDSTSNPGKFPDQSHKDEQSKKEDDEEKEKTGTNTQINADVHTTQMGTSNQGNANEVTSREKEAETSKNKNDVRINETADMNQPSLKEQRTQRENSEENNDNPTESINVNKEQGMPQDNGGLPNEEAVDMAVDRAVDMAVDNSSRDFICNDNKDESIERHDTKL